MSHQAPLRFLVPVAAALAIALTLTAGTPARAQGDPLSPVGTWRTIDDATGKVRSLIKIWEKNGTLYGQVIKLFRTPNEDQNPLCDKCQGAQNNKPVIGMVVMQGLKKDDNEWSGGTILDPESGSTYRCLIEVQSLGKTLKVRGYIGISLLGRTQIWQRVQ